MNAQVGEPDPGVDTMSKLAMPRFLLSRLRAGARRRVDRDLPVRRGTRGRSASVLLAHVVAALCFTFGPVVARAADIVIRMVDMSKDGPLTFDPIFVTANVGDTLVFTPESKGHTTESLLIPEGAKPWKSGYDQSIRIAVEKEGIYLYGCEAHLRMGMVGVVQVGRAVNLDAATKAAATTSAQFVMNKDRFATALARVR